MTRREQEVLVIFVFAGIAGMMLTMPIAMVVAMLADTLGAPDYRNMWTVIPAIAGVFLAWAVPLMIWAWRQEE